MRHNHGAQAVQRCVVHHRFSPQFSLQQQKLLWADVPDAFMVSSPVVAQTEKTTTIEVIVRQASTSCASFAHCPPAASLHVDINVGDVLYYLYAIHNFAGWWFSLNQRLMLGSLLWGQY